MDQQFYYTNPAAESSRPTVVHRLPQTLPYETGSDEISTGRLFLHLFLLGLTVLTTAGVGVLWFYDSDAPQPLAYALWEGIVYSFSIITILAAHEMGHYIACRWYGVSATLPFFIPAPIPPVGTFGAFIKIKSPIPTRRALFDIGIAGPLAGYVFAIPAAFVAHYFALPAPAPDPSAEMIYFQDPLLFKFFHYALGLPEEVRLNPIMWAAWIGVFMTALNLLPVGQLDGGHVTYAVFGHRGHRAIAVACYLTVIGLAIYSINDGLYNWVVYGLILTLMLRVGHPPVVDESEPLGLVRKLVAVIGLLVFILSFMPFPIRY